MGLGVIHCKGNTILRLLKWLKSLLSSGPTEDTVKYYDIESQQLVTIPRSELAPGTVRATSDEIEGEFFVMADQLQEGPIQHPPFTGELKELIENTYSLLGEHLDISMEKWEEGFRRDANPAAEITLWVHAADIYTQFAGGESSAERRRDIFSCIVACLTSSPDAAFKVLDLKAITKSEAEQVVAQFYGVHED